jgi:ArsR family transcriptional regulator
MSPDNDALFRALADEIRRRCLLLLLEHGELCVCELTHALGLPQPKVSHHLGALRKAGMVSDSKHGLWVYYRLNPELPAWWHEILSATHSGLRRLAPYCDDDAALSEMPNRPGASCIA